MPDKDPINTFFSQLSEEEKDAGLADNYPGSRHKRRPVVDQPDSAGWERHAQYKAVGGRRIELFPIGALAAALRRTPASIRLWTRKGYLPRAPYRLPGVERADGVFVPGRRFYTRPMIEAVIALFSERDLLVKERVEWSHYPDLPGLIHQKWMALYEESLKQQSQSEESQ